MNNFLFLILSLIYAHLNGYEINMNQNKLYSWNNQNQIKGQFFVYRVQCQQTETLTKIQELPYNFQIDQECHLNISTAKSSILRPVSKKQYQLKYVYLFGSQIKSEGSLSFSQTTQIQLSSSINVKLSKYSQPNINTQNSLSNSQEKSLYIYNNNDNQLYKFKQNLYFQEPTCYRFSRMNEQLCQQRGCKTLSVQKLVQSNEVEKIDNFTLRQDIFILDGNKYLNQSIQLTFSFPQLNNVQPSTLTYQIEQKIVHSLNNYSMKVQIQHSNKNSESSSSNLRVESKIQFLSQQKIVIKVENINNQLLFNYIRVLFGNQKQSEIFNILKPYENKTYEYNWTRKNDNSNIPSVQILDEQMNIKQTFIMQNQFGNIAVQQKQQYSTSLNNYVEKVETLTYKQRLTLIVAGTSTGVVMLFILILFLCRNRIKAILIDKFHSIFNHSNQDNIELPKQSGRTEENQANIKALKQFDSFQSLVTNDEIVGQNYLSLREFKDNHKPLKQKNKKIQENQEFIKVNQNKINVSLSLNYEQHDENQNDEDLNNPQNLTITIKKWPTQSTLQDDDQTQDKILPDLSQTNQNNGSINEDYVKCSTNGSSTRFSVISHNNCESNYYESQNISEIKPRKPQEIPEKTHEI